MHFQKSILVVLLAMLSFSLFSKPVDIRTARKVALNLVAGHTGGNPVQVYAVDLLSDRNHELIYIIHLNNGNGFVLVSADDRAFPILGYSLEDGFRTQDMPENIRFWINGYKTQIAEAIEHNLLPDSRIINAWKHYLNDEPTATDQTASVAPLITTRWDQGCYYNAQCPVAAGGDCNRAWVGCVATTMAQIIKYHGHPAQGTGSHTYAHPTYGAQTANFGATTYNYSSMPVQLFSNNSATATLSYHCGVAVEMNYGVSGSGAQTSDARNALVNYFNYASSAYFAQKFWYTDANWEAMIRADLESGLPIMYSGYDGTYGHAFVLDGYQGTNFFHFNWGWSGWNNGYFYLSNLNSGNGTFNSQQQAVFHITPPVAPVAQFTAATQNACEKTALQFTSSSSGFPSTYAWTFPGGTPATSTLANPLVTYANPGTYDVKLRVSNALGSDSLTKTGWITVHPKPSKPLPSDTTLCCNMSITLDAANPGCSYVWNTGATSQMIVVDSSGTGIGLKTIILQLTSAYSCVNRDTLNISFAACTGLEEHSATNLKVWPNPGKGFVYFKTPATEAQPAIRLISIDGRSVNPAIIPVSDFTWMLDLTGFPDGVYLLRYENPENPSSTLLILNK